MRDREGVGEESLLEIMSHSGPYDSPRLLYAYAYGSLLGSKKKKK